MGLISIKIQIAGRTYSIRIREDEEGLVRRAEKRIEDQLVELARNYKTDRQDLLAMGMLQNVTESFRNTGEAAEDSSGIYDKINDIDDQLSKFLDGK